MSNAECQRKWYPEDCIAHDCGDTRKLDHFAVNIETGQKVALDFTPYQTMSLEVLDAFVALNFPPRPGAGPWRPSEILAARAEAEAAHV